MTFPIRNIDKEVCILHYDTLVIGSGPAGISAVFPLRQAGKKVAVCDNRRFGGTCPLRGCDPKKILLGTAEAVDRVRNLEDISILGNPSVEWEKLIQYKNQFTDSMSNKIENSLEKAEIDRYHHQATFTGENQLKIGDEKIEAEHIIVATGAKPRSFPIPGFDLLINSEEFMDLKYLPPEIIFVGGGYIGFEFAHIAARAGSHVTILEASDRPLRSFDAGLVDWIRKATEKAGISLKLNQAAHSIIKEGNRIIVNAGPEGDQRYEAGLAVNTVGRVPNLEALQLSKAGIETDGKNIALNEYLQSVSNPAVYVVGDANGRGPQLTPVASYEAEIAAENILHGNQRSADYANIPSALYSIPPAASVGYSEEQAKSEGLDYKLNQSETTDWFSSWRINETISGHRILIEKKTGKILGAHLIGHHSEEIINLFAMAIRHGLSASQMKAHINTYPTVSSNLSYMLS